MIPSLAQTPGQTSGFSSSRPQRPTWTGLDEKTTSASRRKMSESGSISGSQHTATPSSARHFTGTSRDNNNNNNAPFSSSTLETPRRTQRNTNNSGSGRERRSRESVVVGGSNINTTPTTTAGGGNIGKRTTNRAEPTAADTRKMVLMASLMMNTHDMIRENGGAHVALPLATSGDSTPSAPGTNSGTVSLPSLFPHAPGNSTEAGGGGDKGHRHGSTSPHHRNHSAATQNNKKSLRILDRDSGRVRYVDAKHHSVPKREQLIKKKYHNFLQNVNKMVEAEEHVGRLPLTERKELAIASIKRHHLDNLQVMLNKGMLPAEVAFRRTEVSFQMSKEYMFGSLHSDTRELSHIRIHNAAADQILFQEAERLADVEIYQFTSKILPDSVTRVDVLGLFLDAYRQNNVPYPPRRLVPQSSRENSAGGESGSGRVQRRTSFRIGTSSTSQVGLPSGASPNSGERSPGTSALSGGDGGGRRYSGSTPSQPLRRGSDSTTPGGGLGIIGGHQHHGILPMADLN